MSRARLFGRQDLPPQNCAHCGKRMVIGIVLSVMISGEKFRVCSFECEGALKAAKDKEQQHEDSYWDDPLRAINKC